MCKWIFIFVFVCVFPHPFNPYLNFPNIHLTPMHVSISSIYNQNLRILTNKANIMQTITNAHKKHIYIYIYMHTCIKNKKLLRTR